jgi:hypothetical protein
MLDAGYSKPEALRKIEGLFRRSAAGGRRLFWNQECWNHGMLGKARSKAVSLAEPQRNAEKTIRQD